MANRGLRNKKKSHCLCVNVGKQYLLRNDITNLVIPCNKPQ